jgi:16S rRNA (guanine527-N7)-methyltransferase
MLNAINRPPPHVAARRLMGIQTISAEGLNVSRETQRRLEIVVEQLRKWQLRINLVSGNTLEDVWRRHIADSLQLNALQPQAKSWIDLGSGGGFPGLVIAAARADDPLFTMTLIESNGKKCAFLRETARLASLPVVVRHARIEAVVPMLKERVDVVSARALASLDVLLEMSETLIQTGAVCLFPKGQDVDDEIHRASATWHLLYDLIQSQTEAGAAIVVVRSASRKKPSP